MEAARINAQVAAGAAGEEDVIRLRQLRKVYAGRGKAKRRRSTGAVHGRSIRGAPT